MEKHFYHKKPQVNFDETKVNVKMDLEFSEINESTINCCVR